MGISSIKNIDFYHFSKGNKLIFVKFNTNIQEVDGFIVFTPPLPIKAILQKLHELTHLSYFIESPLMLNDQVLNINNMLEDYIDYESECKLTFTINFVPPPDGSMQIFYKPMTGMYITLCAFPSDKIGVLRYRIALKEGFAPRKLVFASKCLENDNTLEDYSVRECSTIYEVMRLSG